MQANQTHTNASARARSHVHPSSHATGLVGPVQSTNPPGEPLVEHEYLFDVRLFASIRVRAASQKEALKMLSESLHCETVSLGEWSDGSQILAEVSADDDADLIEVDGVDVT